MKTVILINIVQSRRECVNSFIERINCVNTHFHIKTSAIKGITQTGWPIIWIWLHLFAINREWGNIRVFIYWMIYLEPSIKFENLRCVTRHLNYLLLLLLNARLFGVLIRVTVYIYINHNYIIILFFFLNFFSPD